MACPCSKFSKRLFRLGQYQHDTELWQSAARNSCKCFTAQTQDQWKRFSQYHAIADRGFNSTQNLAKAD